MKFKVGDKVKVKSHSILAYGEGGPRDVSKDKETIFEIGGINGDGSGSSSINCLIIYGLKCGANYFAPDELELVDSLMQKNLIIQCPTREDFRKVLDKIDDKQKLPLWNDYSDKGGFAARIENSSFSGYDNVNYYIANFPDYKFITAKQFLSNNLTNNDKNMSMNLKEKFTLALTKEPQRSFRKAQVTDGDDIVTDEGLKVVVSWLLNTKYADKFNEEVIQPMLKKDQPKDEEKADGAESN